MSEDPNGGGDHECPICGDSFDSAAEKEEHALEEHRQEL